MKVTVTRNKKEYNEFTLTIKGTAGWLMAIRHSLQYNVSSPIAQEVLLFLERELVVDGKDILDV